MALMAHRLARYALVGTMAFLVSCPLPPCPPTECRWPPDSWVDAGPDGGVDPADALDPADGGFDAAVDGGPDDPGWAVLPDLPTGCVLERAELPERLPTLSWASCGPGCLRADRAPNQLTVDRGFFSDGRGWIATISLAADGEHDIYTIMPVDGPPVAGWRFADATRHPSCWAWWGAVGEGRAGAIAHWESPTSADAEDRLFLALIDALGSTDAAATTVGAPHVGDGRVVDDLAVGSEAAALHVVPSAELLVFHDGMLTPITASLGWYPAATGDHVVWIADAQDALWHWTPETGAEPYYVATPDPPITRVFVDYATLVWVRRVDSGATVRAELWTSPLARIAMGVEPRLVHPDAGEGDARYGDGIYLSTSGVALTFVARLIDVADGRARTLPIPEPGGGCAVAHYVSSTEVLLDCGRVLYRVDPRTLPYDP